MKNTDTVVFRQEDQISIASKYKFFESHFHPYSHWLSRPIYVDTSQEFGFRQFHLPSQFSFVDSLVRCKIDAAVRPVVRPRTKEQSSLFNNLTRLTILINWEATAFIK